MTVEEIIDRNMELLDISYEEAVQMMEDDARIDKMTSTRQIDSDLTEEQKNNAKEARVADRKVSNKPMNRTKKTNATKAELLKTVMDSLTAMGATISFVKNDEREFNFVYNDGEYRITMAMPRQKK